MIEMRWVWHDFENGAPPAGSICVGDRLFQKLQYRQIIPGADVDGIYVHTEWADVPHGGGKA